LSHILIQIVASGKNIIYTPCESSPQLQYLKLPSVDVRNKSSMNFGILPMAINAYVPALI